jgi:hypothetical protein
MLELEQSTRRRKMGNPVRQQLHTSGLRNGIMRLHLFG